VAIGAGLAVVLAGCAQDAAPAPPPQAAQTLVEAARQAAVTAAQGQRPGGTLTMLGLLSGPQLKQYLSTFEPFEQATGIDVKYESTGDLFAVLQTRLAGGNPPDVVSNPSAGQIRQLAADGKLVPLDGVIDMAAAKRDYPAGLIDLTTVGGKLYGLFFNTAVQGLVWYDPKTYAGPTPTKDWSELAAWTTRTAAGGRTPWCVGLASGPNSGWPGAAWIEQVVLKQSGPAVFDAWWQGRQPWTSAPVRQAFQAFGAIATDPKQVAGGPTAVLSSSFTDSPLGMYAKPPTCSLTVQADFLGSTLEQTVPGIKAGTDIAFFPFPGIDPRYRGLLETSGEAIGMLKDTPQTRAFARYLATPQFSALVASTGQWLAVNKQVTPDRYPSALNRQVAALYRSAPDVRYAAQASMPLAMETAFFKAVLDYVKAPDRLDAILAGLDRTRRTAYASA
jgi:alpha-glucoside transport system substrate-binding protein